MSAEGSSEANLLYLVQRVVTAKGHKPMHNWNRILSQQAILHDDRLRLDL